MEEELLLDEAARLYELSRRAEGGSRGLYHRMALDCCRVATAYRAARLFSAGGGRPGGRGGRRGESGPEPLDPRAPAGSCRA